MSGVVVTGASGQLAQQLKALSAGDGVFFPAGSGT